MRRLAALASLHAAAPALLMRWHLALGPAPLALTSNSAACRAARSLASARGDTGPLQPVHIHTAYQMLKDQNKVEASKTQSKRLRL